ncbi:hypothetical protein HY635_01355 [Candidatus Uhrbacteria bacterium]|nr:hypothetical protein [Candidatus Uhrbacteria bacterium]
MRNEKKARSLTMAAVFAALVSVPSIALAGPKFEELERAVAADVMDADAINAALLKALGTDRAAVRAVQTECFGTANPKLISGVLGGSTQSCIRDHADAMARARKHAADDRAAIDKELGTCKVGATDCATARDAAAAAAAAAAVERDRLKAERDALAARVAAGGSDEDSPPGPLDMSAYVASHCPPGFQGRWLKNGQFSCTEPRWTVAQGRPTADPSGTSFTGGLTVTAPPGREGLGQFPVPPPPPEPRATCDGAGGKLLCYVLPVAAAVVGGLLIADAASEDFNLVNVRR